MAYFTKKTKTLVGELTLIASDHGLAAIIWETIRSVCGWSRSVKTPGNDFLVETERQLKSYFDGTLTLFSIHLDFVGTKFQTSVWKALLKIPFG